MLSVDGEAVASKPYRERRRILEEFGLEGTGWRTPGVFDDGDALFEAVCEHELEGVVAERRAGRYMPGRSGWIKTRNRDYWRYEMEREGVVRSRRPRAFV